MPGKIRGQNLAQVAKLPHLGAPYTTVQGEAVDQQQRRPGGAQPVTSPITSGRLPMWPVRASEKKACAGSAKPQILNGGEPSGALSSTPCTPAPHAGHRPL